MVFAILFVVAFLIGLTIFLLSRRWLVAVIISMLLFTVTTVMDTEAHDRWLITLVFGLPIVFFASLLGAYVVQIKLGTFESDKTESDEVERDEAGVEHSNDEHR